MQKEKEKIDWRVIAIGIVCLSAIEIYALSKGMNGMLMSFIAGIIGVAIGVNIPNFIKR